MAAPAAAPLAVTPGPAIPARTHAHTHTHTHPEHSGTQAIAKTTKDTNASTGSVRTCALATQRAHKPPDRCGARRTHQHAR